MTMSVLLPAAARVWQQQPDALNQSGFVKKHVLLKKKWQAMEG